MDVVTLGFDQMLVSPPYTCLTAVFFFSSLDRHVQSHHGHQKPFRCKFCPFKSSYLSRLKSHLHKAHAGETTHTYTRSHTHTHTPALTHTHARSHTHTRSLTHTHTHTHTSALTHTHTHTHVHRRNGFYNCVV